MFDLIIIPISLFLLYVGGEGTLKGVLALAKTLKISNIIVSAVIIGFGTSLAELTVSIEAVLLDAPDIALGNIVGSNTANILLVIGIAALIRPLKFETLKVNFEILILVIATLLLLIFKYLNYLNIYSGFFFLFLLVSFLFFSFKKNNKALTEEDEQLPNYSVIKSLFYCVFGIITLMVAGWLLVNTSVKIAVSFGISETVIGLTIIAIGTSIPELTTAIIASIKKHNDLIIGNVIGSNIFNILGILGITLFFTNIPVTDEMMQKGIWEMIIATIFFVFLLKFKKKISKIIATFMLGAYSFYIFALY